jgi:hypothetical protein
MAFYSQLCMPQSGKYPHDNQQLSDDSMAVGVTFNHQTIQSYSPVYKTKTQSTGQSYALTMMMMMRFRYLTMIIHIVMLLLVMDAITGVSALEVPHIPQSKLNNLQSID